MPSGLARTLSKDLTIQPLSHSVVAHRKGNPAAVQLRWCFTKLGEQRSAGGVVLRSRRLLLPTLMNFCTSIVPRDTVGCVAVEHAGPILLTARVGLGDTGYES